MKRKLGEFTLHESDNGGLVLSHKTVRGTKHYTAPTTDADAVAGLVNLALVSQVVNSEAVPTTPFDKELERILGPLDDGGN